jgi:hypothetical protein
MHHTSLQRRKAWHGMVVAWSCIIFRIIMPIIFLNTTITIIH